jgi:hypothetical protein
VRRICAQHMVSVVLLKGHSGKVLGGVRGYRSMTKVENLTGFRLSQAQGHASGCE